MATDLGKILILEDEKPLAQALGLKLAHEGFSTQNFPNGKDLESILNNEKISLIVCDLIMPEVDGFQVLQFIQDRQIKVPVIVLTNLGQADDERRARDLGATDFFIKSNTSLGELAELIKKRLGKT